MTREIKFRAWDKTLKEMGEVLGLYFDNWVDLTNEGTAPNGQEWRASWRDISLMQFTGLKDKNGKEIYDGDITNRGTVGFYTELHWDGGGSVHSGFYFSNGELDYHSGFDGEIEVIGNIYQNPDLLKSR